MDRLIIAVAGNVLVVCESVSLRMGGVERGKMKIFLRRLTASLI